MRRVRNVVIAIIIVALLGVSASAGLNYIKEMNQSEVMVVSVDSLASDYYVQDTSLEGTITSNVSQKVYLDSDMILQELFVEAGDMVKKGDKLASFDMTLVEMELNIANLKMQKYMKDLAAAEKRLYSLKNGGPIIEDTGSDGIVDMDEISSISDAGNGYYLAVILPSFFTAVFGDGSEVEEDTFEGTDSDSSDSIFGSGESLPPLPTETPIPTPTLVVGDGVDLFIPDYTNGIADFSDGVEKFYTILDSKSAPIKGSGTSDDPFIFLCSSSEEKVIALGSFLNVMAGYSEDGTRIEKEGGYWYQLEFHQSNVVADYNNRQDSCIGYYLIDGCLLSNPINMHAEMEFYLSEASQFETEEPEPPLDFGGITNGGVGSGVTISRADAIKSQQTIIAGLKLDIAELDLQISKLEKKVNKKEVYSKIDGVVANVGEIAGETDGSELLTIESDQGFYVTGSISELMLDRLEEGDTLNCMSYEYGEFEAIVTDIAEYPGTSNYYGGTGNPNVSFYTFSAEIPDQSMEMSSGEWITITLPEEVSDENSLVLSKAFVKSENGVSFVYKDDQGVLKKQVVAVGGNVDGGYSVLIKGGITRNDFIAFPYGKDVVEGAKTKEATLDELYGY